MKEKEDVKILVIGDIMLDKYIYGTVERISPEAPVAIVNVTKEYHTLGGCGNVVRNLRELGARVDCISFTGRDLASTLIHDELKSIDVNPAFLIHDSRYQTIVKTRIIADERKVQMLRIDHEDVREVNDRQAIVHLKRYCKNDYDMIVISDYAKGMISYQLMEYLKVHQDAPIIVDPKPAHGYMYNDVFMITPNEKEWASMVVSSKYALKNVPYILETRGRDGMIMHMNDATTHIRIDSNPVEIFNVSGAGDTVVAVMALCLSLDYEPVYAARIANECAAYVVTQPGTSIVSKNKFIQIQQYINRRWGNKK